MKRKDYIKCGNKELYDPYQWLESANNQNIKWTNNENQKADQWFSTHTTRNKRQKNPKNSFNIYFGAEESNKKSYATKMLENGVCEVVEFNSSFNYEKVLFTDENEEYNIVEVWISPDHNYIAMQIMYPNDANPGVLVKDLTSSTIVFEQKNVYSLQWSAKEDVLFYSVVKNDIESQKKFHVVESVELKNFKRKCYFIDKTELAFVYVNVIENGLLLNLSISYNYSRLLYFDFKTNECTQIMNNEKGIVKFLGAMKQILYILSTEKKSCGEIIEYNLVNQNIEIMPINLNKNTVIQGAGFLKDEILLVALEDMVSNLYIYNITEKLFSHIELPDPMGSVMIYPECGIRTGCKASHLYFCFQSFKLPTCLCQYSYSDKTIKVLNCKNKLDSIKVKRHFIQINQNTKIGYFLVYKKDISLFNKSTIMSGYGAFGECNLPCYNNPYLAMDIKDWVEKGGLYVHCVVRGGGEFGSSWHDDGKLLNKNNSFEDFIKIARDLIDKEYTSSEKLVIAGGSAGGLLVLGSMIKQPDLFSGVIATLPQTDMVKFFENERSFMYKTEYGDPLNEKDLEILLSYSPYHNINPNIKYPPIYMLCGELDNNAPPYNAKKMTARLSENKNNFVLLRSLHNTGHSLGEKEEKEKVRTEIFMFASYFSML